MPDISSWIPDALAAIKAVDVVILPVSHLTEVTDTMVVCTGTSSTHIKAIAERIVTAAKANNLPPLGVEGLDGGEWVLVDLGEAVIHIMLQPIRELYDIEKLWDYTEDIRNQNESS